MKQESSYMNNLTPWTSASKAPISPLSEEIAALVDRGFLPYLRPCAPPGVELHIKRGVKISDGKLPSTYSAGRWVGFPGWLAYQPKSSDVLEWSTWTGAGLCLVTGDVCAFDIDIKFDDADESEPARRGRKCIAAIIKLLTTKLDRAAADIPLRGRANSTSCAFFVRVSSRVEKQIVTLFETDSDRKHKVEFLACGQQIVIAGTHDSGARVRSSLSKYPLDHIPTISVETLQEIMGEIATIAQRNGYATEKKAQPKAPGGGLLKPEFAVAREIMRRRADWVPSIVPCSAGKADQEWRISSEELDRDLEEDLCVYSDGIFDHGTERTHTAVSFIREFGAIDQSSISFGGCPRYGRRGKFEFAVVGEIDPVLRRPTEAEALNWLCRQLAGETFPALPADATWSTSWRAVAAAVGVDWRALAALQVNLLFSEIDDAGNERPFKPEEWSADDLKRNHHLVAAIRFADPEWLARLEFAWELSGAVSSSVVTDVLASDAQRVREHAEAAGYAGIFGEAQPAASSPEFPEPLDLFSDDDPADLGEPPPGSLPMVIERWARSEARRKGVPFMFAAGAAIGVVSSAIGTSLKICPRMNDDGWTEPAGLWLALVADPGSAKSPIISAAVEPLRKLDAERWRADKSKHDAWFATSKKKGQRRPRSWS